MVEAYKWQFREYVPGKNLKPKQILAIQNFCQEDLVQQLVKAQQLFPGLMDVANEHEIKYDGFLVDPPWPYVVFHKSGCPYKLMEFEDLVYLGAAIRQLRNHNSFMLLWTTGTHLFLALNLLNLWEYKYINVLIVWRKLKKDYTTNGRT